MCIYGTCYLNFDELTNYYVQRDTTNTYFSGTIILPVVLIFNGNIILAAFLILEIILCYQYQCYYFSGGSYFSDNVILLVSGLLF